MYDVGFPFVLRRFFYAWREHSGEVDVNQRDYLDAWRRYTRKAQQVRVKALLFKASRTLRLLRHVIGKWKVRSEPVPRRRYVDIRPVR